MRNVAGKRVEKIETRILCSVFFFENFTVYKILWGKYCRVGQTTDDNVAHCMVDTEDY